MSAPALYQEPVQDLTTSEWDDDESFPQSWLQGDERALSESVDVIPIGPSLAWKTIVDAARGSRRILDLADDWDNEGSSSYTFAQWKRATDLLLAHARVARDVLRVDLPKPIISPAESGSIDIYWRDESRTLLINIPADAGERPTYYGESKSGDTLAGQLAVDATRPDLVAWLVSQA